MKMISPPGKLMGEVAGQLLDSAQALGYPPDVVETTSSAELRVTGVPLVGTVVVFLGLAAGFAVGAGAGGAGRTSAAGGGAGCGVRTRSLVGAGAWTGELPSTAVVVAL